MEERCFPLITNTLLSICLKMLVEQVCSDLLDDEVARERKEGFGSYGLDCRSLPGKFVRPFVAWYSLMTGDPS